MGVRWLGVTHWDLEARGVVSSGYRIGDVCEIHTLLSIFAVFCPFGGGFALRKALVMSKSFDGKKRGNIRRAVEISSEKWIARDKAVA